jgi:hypothetical protein
MNKFLIIIILLFSITLLISCEKRIKEFPEPGKLEKIQLTDLSGIPLEYGKLINVTTHAAYEGWSQLWFEDENNIIRMVRVQFHTNRINDMVLVIPRN